jgi:hypothetical protein
LCERETAHLQAPPPVPPEPMPVTNRRPRELDTSQYFCPMPVLTLRLVRAWQSTRQRPSQWRPLAPGPLHVMQGLLSRDARHDLPRQTGGSRAGWTRLGLPG